MIGAPSFKIVVVTNSTALDRPEVQHGLKLLTRKDEIWAKLDGGTQDYLNRLNGAAIPLEKIMANIVLTGRQRPVVIQSLFPAINGAPPPAREITQYARRLRELKEAGAEIPLVQIYSATRPMARTGCTHLPLQSLSQIAKTVRRVAGLRAEDPDLSVILRGDGQTPFLRIRAVLDACQQANVAKLDLATDPIH